MSQLQLSRAQVRWEDGEALHVASTFWERKVCPQWTSAKKNLLHPRIEMIGFRCGDGERKEALRQTCKVQVPSSSCNVTNLCKPASQHIFLSSQCYTQALQEMETVLFYHRQLFISKCHCLCCLWLVYRLSLYALSRNGLIFSCSAQTFFFFFTEIVLNIGPFMP